MELKWSLPQFQDKLIPRLGGLHVSMNFLKAIGDHMNGSGLAGVWGEMGLLGPGVVELVLAGKAYNKAMRAHKLTLQALWRLLMPSLLSFVAEADADCHACLSRMAADDDSQTIPELITFLDQDKFRKSWLVLLKVGLMLSTSASGGSICIWSQYCCSTLELSVMTSGNSISTLSV